MDAFVLLTAKRTTQRYSRDRRAENRVILLDKAVKIQSVVLL